MSLLSKLFSAGIQPGDSISEIKKVRLLNITTLFAALLVFFFIGFFIYLKVAEALIIQFPNLAAFLAVYFLSRSRKHLAARFLFCIWFPLFLMNAAISAGDSGTKAELMLIPTALMVIFLFDKRIHIISLFIFILGLFLTAKAVQNAPGYAPRMANIESTHFIYYFEIIMCFTVLYLVAILFKKESERFEEEVTIKNKELEVQRRAIAIGRPKQSPKK